MSVRKSRQQEDSECRGNRNVDARTTNDSVSNRLTDRSSLEKDDITNVVNKLPKKRLARSHAERKGPTSASPRRFTSQLTVTKRHAVSSGAGEKAFLGLSSSTRDSGIPLSCHRPSNRHSRNDNLSDDEANAKSSMILIKPVEKKVKTLSAPAPSPFATIPGSAVNKLASSRETPQFSQRKVLRGVFGGAPRFKEVPARELGPTLHASNGDVPEATDVVHTSSALYDATKKPVPILVSIHAQGHTANRMRNANSDVKLPEDKSKDHLDQAKNDAFDADYQPSDEDPLHDDSNEDHDNEALIRRLSRGEVYLGRTASANDISMSLDSSNSVVEAASRDPITCRSSASTESTQNKRKSISSQHALPITSNGVHHKTPGRHKRLKQQLIVTLKLPRSALRALCSPRQARKIGNSQLVVPSRTSSVIIPQRELAEEHSAQHEKSRIDSVISPHRSCSASSPVHTPPSSTQEYYQEPTQAQQLSAQPPQPPQPSHADLPSELDTLRHEFKVADLQLRIRRMKNPGIDDVEALELELRVEELGWAIKMQEAM